MTQIQNTSGESRVWIQPQGCNTQMMYGGCYGMGDVTIPEGDITYIRCPSRSQPSEWDIIGQIVGVPGNKTASLEAPLDLVNYLLTIKCEFNVQVRLGKCDRPDNPLTWESMLSFRNARITQRSVSNLNARTPETNEVVLVMADIVFDEMEFLQAPAYVSSTVTSTADAALQDVSFCDDPMCAGACGVGSTGCQVGYVVTAGIVAGEELWKTVDGGDNWVEITSPFASVYDDIIGVDCAGDVVILISGTTASTIARSADGGATWTIIDVGGAQILADVHMLDGANVWLTGAGGYIWYSSDAGLTWTIQDAGVATAEDLKEIHFADTDTGLAVGDAGAIVRTANGGADWAAVTSGVATDLKTVFCVTDLIMWAGGATATVLYSMNGGITWVEKTWPGTGTDTINAISFCGCMFGYFGATSVALAGVLYDTVDGGYTLTARVLPTNAGINAIECCDPGTVFIATNADGVLLKT